MLRPGAVSVSPNSVFGYLSLILDAIMHESECALS